MKFIKFLPIILSIIILILYRIFPNYVKLAFKYIKKCFKFNPIKYLIFLLIILQIIILNKNELLYLIISLPTHLTSIISALIGLIGTSLIIIYSNQSTNKAIHTEYILHYNRLLELTRAKIPMICTKLTQINVSLRKELDFAEPLNSFLSNFQIPNPYILLDKDDANKIITSLEKFKNKIEDVNYDLSSKLQIIFSNINTLFIDDIYTKKQHVKIINYIKRINNLSTSTINNTNNLFIIFTKNGPIYRNIYSSLTIGVPTSTGKFIRNDGGALDYFEQIRSNIINQTEYLRAIIKELNNHK